MKMQSSCIVLFSFFLVCLRIAALSEQTQLSQNSQYLLWVLGVLFGNFSNQPVIYFHV